MNKRLVTEEELKKRLIKTGKAPEEIEQLINEYLDVSNDQLPDSDAIAEILNKSKTDSVLRVKAFKLTRDQYDILYNYYEELGIFEPGQEIDTRQLVQRAMEDFINLLQ